MVGGQDWKTTSDLWKLEDGVRKEQRSNFLEIGKLLTEILDSELYTLKGYKSFVKYIDDEPVFRFTGKHAIRLVRTYRFINSLPPGVGVPTSERQVRPLIKLGFEDARNVWLEAQRRTKLEGKTVTGELVAELVSQLNKTKGLQAMGNQRKTRPHTRPRRCGQESDTSHTEDEDMTAVKMEETPCWNGDGTQSAVLLLAEFENLRERMKDLPQQQRERLLLEWRDSMDEDLNTMESSYGSRSGGSVGEKRTRVADPGTPTSFAQDCSLERMDSSDFVFTVRKKRSNSHPKKRVWRVPSYPEMQPAVPWMLSENEFVASEMNPTSTAHLVDMDTESSPLGVQGTRESFHAFCGRLGLPQDVKQSASLSFRLPFVSVTAK